MTNDPVNHPSHYTYGKYEVIDFIESWGFGFHLGNAVKYISRAGKKDPAKTLEDLNKALWYIKRFLDWPGRKLFIEDSRKEKIDPDDYTKDKGLDLGLATVIQLLAEIKIHDACSVLEAYVNGMQAADRREA